MNSNIRFAMGNEAIVEGAIAAGARFFAGYPITPSSEIAELSSRRLPQVGGIYIQMEDEIASIATVIGASAAGKKAFTATSGPGFSLMQENLGTGIIAEVPCVIIDVMRSGPGTGLATKPAQADVMQTRWGTHGDHGIIVLSPSSVQECYDLTIEAFCLSEKYRTPVVLLSDEIVSHMRERYEILPEDAQHIAHRKTPSCDPKDYHPYDFENQKDGIAPLASFGGKYVFRLNSSTHDETGTACAHPDNACKFIHHYVEKFEQNKHDIVHIRRINMDDADYIIIAYGCSVRSACAAMKLARAHGKRVGVLQLITLWPFAGLEVCAALEEAKGVIVPEMNMGQILGEVQKYNPLNRPVLAVNRVDSLIISPEQILEKLKELC